MAAPATRAGALMQVGLAAHLLLFVAPVTAHEPSFAPGGGASAPPSSAPSSAPDAADTTATQVSLVDFDIVPDTLGSAELVLTLDAINDGITPHNLTVRDAEGTVLAATPTLSQGESSALMVVLPEPGTYTTFCSLPGHESLGMRGELVVSSGDEDAGAASTEAPAE